MSARAGLCRLRHPPNGIADIVGDKQRSIARNRHANRAAESLFVVADKTGNNIDWVSRGFPGGKSNENNFVAAQRSAIPRAMLADENAVRELVSQLCAIGKCQSKRRYVIPECIIRRDRFGDEFGILRLYAVIDVLSPVA